MIKEADFALRQAFALCPYSPEALFRYVNLLISPEVQRFDDALLLARTSQKLDPFNASFVGLVNSLEGRKIQRAGLNPAKMEQDLQQNPGNFQLALELASQYFQLGQTGAALQALDQVLNGSNVPTALLRSLLPVYSTLSNEPKLQKTSALLASQFQSDPANLEAGIALAESYRDLHQSQRALQILDEVIGSPNADGNVTVQAAQEFAALADYPRLEVALEKLARLEPNSPEAWYDLAALRSILGKSSASLQALRQALKLGAERRIRDPKARDLLAEVQQDPRFQAIRPLPEFRELTQKK
jgi:thioredoxin-like negative regulator of GroEL